MLLCPPILSTSATISPTKCSQKPGGGCFPSDQFSPENQASSTVTWGFCGMHSWYTEMTQDLTLLEVLHIPGSQGDPDAVAGGTALHSSLQGGGLEGRRGRHFCGRHLQQARSLSWLCVPLIVCGADCHTFLGIQCLELCINLACC